MPTHYAGKESKRKGSTPSHIHYVYTFLRATVQKGNECPLIQVILHPKGPI